MASCHCSALFGTLPVSCGWRSAPQCCAWQSVQGGCRVRQPWVLLGREVSAIGGKRSRLYRWASTVARNPRDAQPFHREDSPRQAGSSLSCQTLGIAVTTSESPTHNNAAEFSWQEDDVFGRIASRYDKLCDAFSFGIHRLWKRRVAQRITSESWNTLLDGATGTGDIILRVVASQSAKDRTVIASDVSPKMLAIAAKRLRAHKDNVHLQLLDAENMPSIQSGSVDAYSISLGLKICNRHLAIQEALRVLRPGGRLIVLEASTIRWAFLNRAYLAYMSICMPVLGWLATGGDASAYKYLLQGIRDFPSAEKLADELEDHGFIDVAFERLSLGIVAIHTARKPPESRDA
jgi:demethylmenaquinone methyltransferase/2-methoxy-6-polyprenyl-1,4-benzoquinol methylase